jgi:hypothetical protein
MLKSTSRRHLGRAASRERGASEHSSQTTQTKGPLGQVADLSSNPTTAAP